MVANQDIGIYLGYIIGIYLPVNVDYGWKISGLAMEIAIGFPEAFFATHPDVSGDKQYLQQGYHCSTPF